MRLTLEFAGCSKRPISWGRLESPVGVGVWEQFEKMKRRKKKQHNPINSSIELRCNFEESGHFECYFAGFNADVGFLRKVYALGRFFFQVLK